MAKNKSVSSAESHLFELFREQFPTIEQQFIMRFIRSGSKRKYSYDFKYENKIIEFHGDYWHAHPLLYAENFIHPKTKRSSLETWIHDCQKTQHAIDHGFSVLIVWESDYKSNKQEVIDRCIRFLLK